MKIRRASEADIPRLVEMSAQFLSDPPYNQLFHPDPALTRDLIEVCLEHGVGFVAEHETGMVCGMIGAVLLPYHPLTGQPYASEMVWWVHPNFRKSTVGPRLIDVVEAWATTSGATMLEMKAPVGSRAGQYLEHRKHGGKYIALETSYVLVLVPHDGQREAGLQGPDQRPGSAGA